MKKNENSQTQGQESDRKLLSFQQNSLKSTNIIILSICLSALNGVSLRINTGLMEVEVSISAVCLWAVFNLTLINHVWSRVEFISAMHLLIKQRESGYKDPYKNKDLRLHECIHKG